MEVALFFTSLVVASGISLRGSKFSVPKPSNVTESIEYKNLLRRCESERRGRINTEVKFRKYIKEQTSVSNPSSPDVLLMNPIAYIRTPFIKKTGCPRQPQTCPSSLGQIVLTKETSRECLTQLESYSHVWVIFTFDNNTNVRTSAVNYKAKITPPRIKPPGTKVGCLSTRTPHRPNNVGLSLLKLQSVSKSTITVTGVDLCDKTPIYDIKPFVPWDVPGYVSGGSWEGEMLDVIRCPDWVWDPAASSSLSTRPPPVLSPSLNPGSTVDWTSESLTDLQSLVSKGTFSPLYPKKSPTSFELVKAAVTEILLQDPRHNRQKGTKTGSDGYKIVFCEATVTFCVEEGGARVIEVKEAEWEDGDDGRMRFMKKK